MIDAKTQMDEQELVRLYLSDALLLKPGAVGGLDTGHAKADEVFFCAKGRDLDIFRETIPTTNYLMEIYY